MIDVTKYSFRNATLSDVYFLAEVIIEAKKGSSSIVGMANLFEISIDSFRDYLIQMLEEEIDGCDFSVSSFIIAEFENKPVAAFGGWIEGVNEDEMPSALLKSNLIGYVFPKEVIIKAQQKSDIISSLQIERQEGVYQLEYGYTVREHRGHGLIGKIIEKHIERAHSTERNVTKMQVLVYENNIPAINSYRKSGFQITQHFESSDSRILDYFPYNREVLMEKELFY